MLSKKCECFYLTELNMDINVISKKFIRVCVKHSDKIFTEVVERKNYRFCKKKKLYYIRDVSSASMENTIDLDGRMSYSNQLVSKDSVDSDDSTLSNHSSLMDSLIMKNCSDRGEHKIAFGKYKGMTFNELLKKDKKYCMNIMSIEINKGRDTIPANMSDLSEYVKEYVSSTA